MLALQTKNKIETALALKEFKDENGCVDMQKLLSLPSSYRITEMAKEDFKGMFATILVALTNAFETMNLSRPISGEQIAELTDAIIEEAAEDQLKIEDLMIFLQGLVRGKYGKLYESMDIPKFFDLFENYRQQRHETWLRWNEERHAQVKVQGPTERNSDDKNSEMETMRNAMMDYQKKEWLKNGPKG